MNQGFTFIGAGTITPIFLAESSSFLEFVGMVNPSSMLSLDDTKRLHQTYMERRNRYASQITGNEKSEINRKLLHCASAADLCMHTYVYFAEYLTQASKQRQEAATRSLSEYQERQSEILEKVNSSSAELADDPTQETAALVLTEAELLLGLARQNAANEEVFHRLSGAKVALTTWLFVCNHWSLETLLNVSNAEDIQKAIRAIAKAYASLIPGVGIALKVWTLYEARKPNFAKRVKEANQLDDELSTFLQAAYNWCLMVQVVVDHMKAAQAGKPYSQDVASLQTAAETVRQRFCFITGIEAHEEFAI